MAAAAGTVRHKATTAAAIGLYKTAAIARIKAAIPLPPSSGPTTASTKFTTTVAVDTAIAVGPAAADFVWAIADPRLEAVAELALLW